MNNFPYNPTMNLEQYERSIILSSYRYHRGNRIMTASALGITTKTLYNKLKSYLDKDPELGINIGEPEAEEAKSGKRKQA